MTRILNGFLLTIVIILVIMSIIALLTIHWTLSNKSSFLFSTDGINTYLTAFGQYKALFTSAVASIATYLGLLRLKVATDANKDRLEHDRFSEWKMVLDIRIIEIDKKDSSMKREFIKVRYDLFKQLYILNFTISNREQLIQVFETNFKQLAGFFEAQNREYIDMGGIYPNSTYSYSFDSFRFLLLGYVDNIYTDIVTDLNTLYLSALPTDRHLNNEIYRIALTRNLKTV